MLINLSNHPSDKWNEEQKYTAVNLYDSVSDMKFPHIAPEAELSEIKNLAESYLDKIKNIFDEHHSGNNAVHIMGEFTFTFCLLEMLKTKNFKAVASTTTRNVHLDDKGNKVTVFNFVRFRNYY